MATDPSTEPTLATPTDGGSGVASAADCSRIRCGRYANGKGAWMEIRGVQLPGYSDYDGGLPGVSVQWGKKKWFVMARDEEHFWNTWPWSIFRDHFISENNQDRA